MSTVILKWNPAVSSYSMSDFLEQIASGDTCSDWSVWDHEKIKIGDDFYMIKVGYGANGIVAAGKIISEPECDESWKKDGKKIFYCDYECEVMINPDAFPLLESKELEKEIPDFDWFGGHAGVVLTEEQSNTLKKLWENYIQKITPEFNARLSGVVKRNGYNDQFYYYNENFSYIDL